MTKLFSKRRLIFLVSLLIILIIPSFWRLLRPGFFSTQDFHAFRLYEIHQCLIDGQIPCRWAMEAGFGYGEPVFNFYGQMAYWPGEVLHLLGFQIIDSLKFLFVLSLAGSALAMFFLAKQIWSSSLAGLISAFVYVYAPYRAVDVYVRGALPEAMAFALFPVIIYFLNAYFKERKRGHLLLFSLFLALLALTHNLSLLMFLIFLFPWTIFLIWKTKRIDLIKHLAWASGLSLGLIAFYLLPLIIEARFVTLGKTIEGYFDYRAHFVTLNQLFLSRDWGYGASLWGPVDDLSLAIGHLQWFLPILVLIGFLVLRKSIKKHQDKFLTIIVLMAVGWLSLFLTHNQSQPIWQLLPFLAFIQFPWRWLAIALFSFSLSTGAFVFLFKKEKIKIGLVGLLFLFLLVLNFNFFQEDLWFAINDQEQFSGERWQEQIAASINDFWPFFGKKTPISPAPKLPLAEEGEIEVLETKKRSNWAEYQILVNSEKALVQLPITFFPGWRGKIDYQPVDIFPSGDYGQITFSVPEGEHFVSVEFVNTPIRTIGNYISVLAFLILITLLIKTRNLKNEA